MDKIARLIEDMREQSESPAHVAVVQAYDQASGLAKAGYAKRATIRVHQDGVGDVVVPDLNLALAREMLIALASDPDVRRLGLDVYAQ